MRLAYRGEPSERTAARRWPVSRDRNPSAEPIRIALVINMPDAAQEDTENQFLGLLTSATATPLDVEFYSLPEIRREERAREHMRGLYSNFGDLFSGRFDGLIITGTEPRQSDLRREAYWDSLVALFDWAEKHTRSAILSCLAAHANVLHKSGIERRALQEKRLGVFEEARVSDHALLAHAPDVMRIPHSRWNELREEDLVSAGYTVLTRSAKAGVGLFARQEGASLVIHSQGHPEYGTDTLLKEYRRDIKRFLRNEREDYPSAPQEYFASPALKLLSGFEERATARRDEGTLAFFPDQQIVETLRNGWHTAGTAIYRNWLQYLASSKSGFAGKNAMTALE